MVSFVLFGLGSTIAWVAWIYTLIRFDPLANGLGVHLLFQASLGLAFLGTLIILALIWHKRRIGRMASSFELKIIVRQILLFVLFVIVVLNLASNNLLRWWNIIPLALLTITMEFFFSSINRKRI